MQVSGTTWVAGIEAVSGTSLMAGTTWIAGNARIFGSVWIPQMLVAGILPPGIEVLLRAVRLLRVLPACARFRCLSFPCRDSAAIGRPVLQWVVRTAFKVGIVGLVGISRVVLLGHGALISCASGTGSSGWFIILAGGVSGLIG